MPYRSQRTQPGGRGSKRFRKTFRTLAEANAYKAWLTSQANQNAKWLPEKRDTRKLSELLKLWYTHHGVGLKADADTCSRLKFLCDGLDDPVADRFKVEDFAAYRTRRLAAGTQKNSIKREHAYLRSVFNELRRLGSGSETTHCPTCDSSRSPTANSRFSQTSRSRPCWPS